MKPRWLVKIFDRIKVVMDKNKSLDMDSTIGEHWQTKFRKTYLSSGDLNTEDLHSDSQYLEVIPQGSHVIMNTDYTSSLSDELSVKKKERACVLLQHDRWLYVQIENGKEGFIPLHLCHKESNVDIHIQVTQCKAITASSSDSQLLAVEEGSFTTRTQDSDTETLAVPGTSTRSELEEKMIRFKPSYMPPSASGYCDSGCPSDSEASDCFPLPGEMTDTDRLSQLEKLLSQLCTKGNFYDAAKCLDNFKKQVNIRKSCARYDADNTDEVSTETGQLLVELGRTGNCALVCTDKGDRGYIPTNFLLKDTRKVACFAMEQCIFQSQSMENVQHLPIPVFKNILEAKISECSPTTSPRQECASASTLYDIKRKELLKDLKESFPKIHRSFKVRKHNKGNRFSKIRNFTIATPRGNRSKSMSRNCTNCLALLVTESYTVGSGSRQLTIKKGDTLITTDTNISSKTWIWAHTTGGVKWQGFVPRANIKKMSSV